MSFHTEITRALLATAPTAAQEVRTTARRIPTIDGDYRVEVLGFVMLQKVVPGRYRLAIRAGIAYFYKPKGSKLIVAHREGDVRMANGREGDLNGINYVGAANAITDQALFACTPELTLGPAFTLAITFDPQGKYAGQDYTITQEVVEVDNDTKEYVLVATRSNSVETGNPIRRSYADLHKQLREDTRLTRLQ